MTKIPISQMSCRAACGALLTTALALATPAAADDGAEEMPWKRLGLDVGSMVMTFDSELSLDTNSGDLGTSINLEEVLGLDENLASFRARGYWRFLPRHTIDLQYYQLKREGNVAATGGFELGDIQVGVGAALDSELRLDTWKAS